MTTLYLSPVIAKQIEELRFSSRKGHLALESYGAICDILHKGGDTLSKRTKHGERRINGCVKYDLGSGYRLVTIRRKGAVHLVCIANHDEVDTWLERNKNWAPSPSSQVFVPVTEKTCKVAGFDDEPDLYEENLLKKIDEDVLRHVFAGLYTARKEHVI